MIRSRMFAAAGIVATVVLGAQTWHKAFRVGGNDLTSYLLSARALWDGQSPYGLETPFPYLYPLFLAFVIAPLTLLPYGAAVIAWFAASVAALGAILLGSTKLGTSGVGRWSSGSALAIAATVLVTFNIIQNNLLNGQVNFLVVLCCVVSVAAERDRRETAAGAWLGAAIALKLMPALLLVYFLVRRQFRAIAGAVVTALVLMLAPGILLSGAGGGVESGFSRITGVYSQYIREVLPPMTTTPEGAVLAYSVAGHLQRVLGTGSALWIDVLCAAGVLGTIAVTDVRIWRRRGDDLAAAAAYLVAVVLISPKSETHHLAFAIPAVALCFGWLFAARSPGPPEGGHYVVPEGGHYVVPEGGHYVVPEGGHYVLLSSAALVAAPFTGAAEGPMITAAMVLLIAAVSYVPTTRTPR